MCCLVCVYVVKVAKWSVVCFIKCMSLDSLPLTFPLSLLLSFSPHLLFPFFLLLDTPFFRPFLSPFFFLSSHSSASFVLFPYPLLPLLPSLPLPQLAKTQFMQNQDPLDASLFYLAMKKKTLLKGLFRYVYMQFWEFMGGSNLAQAIGKAWDITSRVVVA